MFCIEQVYCVMCGWSGTRNGTKYVNTSNIYVHEEDDDDDDHNTEFKHDTFTPH